VDCGCGSPDLESRALRRGEKLCQGQYYIMMVMILVTKLNSFVTCKQIASNLHNTLLPKLYRYVLFFFSSFLYRKLSSVPVQHLAFLKECPLWRVRITVAYF
jgi:hypothetical protein